MSSASGGSSRGGANRQGGTARTSGRADFRRASGGSGRVADGTASGVQNQKLGARAPGTAAGANRPRPPASRGLLRRIPTGAYIAGVIGIVVVVVIVMVAVSLTGGSSNPTSPSNQAPVAFPAKPADVAALAAIPTSVWDAVGTGSSVVAAPTILKGQPPLVIDGKPGAVFVGGEFCPYCAAERWSIIVAFSRFGTFSGLQETTSSPWDVDPSTPTFSFHGASYTSQYVTFKPVEVEGNDTRGPDTRGPLDQPSALQTQLWQKYDNGGNSFPFLDIGNVLVVTSPSYDPALLAGLTQSEVVAKLANPNDQVTQAIVGAANDLTAALCSLTGQQPASVCSVHAIVQAAAALHLG